MASSHPMTTRPTHKRKAKTFHDDPKPQKKSGMKIRVNFALARAWKAAQTTRPRPKFPPTPPPSPPRAPAPAPARPRPRTTIRLDFKAAKAVTFKKLLDESNRPAAHATKGVEAWLERVQAGQRPASPSPAPSCTSLPSAGPEAVAEPAALLTGPSPAAPRSVPRRDSSIHDAISDLIRAGMSSDEDIESNIAVIATYSTAWSAGLSDSERWAIARTLV